MANNRLYIVHRPTGLMACLGKRMGVGWYDASAKELAEMFQKIEESGTNQDDFAIGLEDATNNPDCIEITGPSGGQFLSGIAKLSQT